MWRHFQCLDQQVEVSCTFQTIEPFGVNHHHRIAAVPGDMLRPIAVCQAHEFNESRLGVLKAPAAALRLYGRC